MATPALEDTAGMAPPLAYPPNQRRWSAHIPIGAAGATGTILSAPYGFACAKNGTGIYDCTGLPPCPAGQGRFFFQVYSPGSPPTVGGAVVTAYDLNAGTMTFKTVVGVTVTQPASGDIIWLFFEGECR